MSLILYLIILYLLYLIYKNRSQIFGSLFSAHRDTPRRSDEARPRSDRRHTTSTGEDIINGSEQEYVDFEEVKDDKNGQQKQQ